MITYNKIFVPAAIYVAVLFHVVILLRPFRIASPEDLQEPPFEFRYIEAVIVEEPAPEPIAVDPPPIPEPEPPPPVEKLPDPVSEAVEIREEPEVEAPDLVEYVADEAQESATGPPGPSQQAAVVSSIPAAAVPETPAPAAQIFLPFYRVEKRPAFLETAPLQYPVQAKRQRIEGVVIIEADIDSEGTIVDTRVIKEVGFGFEEAAIEMLRASLFSPAIIDGRPVAVRMRFTIEFRLN